MKRWRRITLIAALVLFVIVLGLIGALKWLQSSGRLAQYAQELVQEQSGQNLSFDSVNFVSWNVIALTNVRLQQALPGWQMDVTCPRVEARYTLQGLRQKQISSVHLIQPNVHLQTSETPMVPDTGEAPTVIALPVKRIQIRDAVLHVDHGDTPYAFKRIDVSVHQITSEQVGLDARASFDDDTAITHIKGELSLDLAHPAGTFDVSLSNLYIPRLAARGLLPDDWTLTEGLLNVTAAQVELRGQVLKGTLNINLEKGQGDIAAVAVQDVAISTDMTFEANISDQTLSLQGPMQLQASKVKGDTVGFEATQLSTQLPVQLTYAPDQWHIHTDLRLQSEQVRMTAAGGIQLRQLLYTASLDAKSMQQGWSLKGDVAFEAPSGRIGNMRLKQLGGKTPVTLTATAKQWQSSIALSVQSQALSAKDTFRLQRLSSQLPLDIKSTPRGWLIQGMINTNVARLAFGGIKFNNLQSQLPIWMTPAALTTRDLHIQAKAVHWQSDGAGPPITSPLDLRGTVALSLKRQQAEAKDLVLNLTTLGRIKGNGTWQWATGTARDVRLSITPTAIETIWPHVAAQLPAPYPTWFVTGQTRAALSIPRMVWRDGAPSQPLSIDWHLSNAAFSSPEGDYAGENINGHVQATISLTPEWRPASMRASLNFKPFALLIGSFFPELEQNNITSTVTLKSTYHQAGHVDLSVDSRFGALGQVVIDGKLDLSQSPVQADVTCRLRQIDIARTWRTFMPEALRQAEVPPAMQGRLNSHLQIRGALSKARLQGNLQVAAFHLQSASLALRNLSLQLPIDVRYPLPERLPDLAALPASAYGQLQVEQMQFGGLQIPGITTKLAMRSDSIIFQNHLQATLLKGVLHLQDLVAYHVLQPQRQIRMQMRLRAINLKHLQRDAGALPIAGQIDADFPRLHYQNGRLQTQGSLQLRVAGGRIRIYDVAGWDLGSQIPSVQSSLKTEKPLSLRQLTQIYPIGYIGGTLHFSVDDLVITASEPAAFRLRFHVQKKGGETREISLEALNNLLFTTGSTRLASSVADLLPYRRFGAEITLQHDTLRLRGLYKDRKKREYFMRAPALGGGVSIVNRTPQNGTPFRSFVQRLKSTVLERPNVSIK